MSLPRRYGVHKDARRTVPCSILFGIIILSCIGCIPTYKGGSIEEYEKNYMVTGYINYPKNEAEIENNRRVEKQYINLAPMFGYAKKNAHQIRTDSNFIITILDSCKCSRSEASKKSSDKGWYYLKKGNSELASKRLNQAFLLDSSNVNVPWGFGAIMARQGRFSESIPLFEKAFSIFNKPKDTVYGYLCTDCGLTLANAYRDTKKTEYSDKSAKYLDEAITLVPNDGMTYFNYAVLYYYKAQYQKALESYYKAISLQSWNANKDFLQAVNDSLNKK